MSRITIFDFEHSTRHHVPIIVDTGRTPTTKKFDIEKYKAEISQINF